MPIPTSDHLLSLAENLGAAYGAYRFLRKRIRAWFHGVVAEAVRGELQPIAAKVEEIDRWYQVVSKAFGSKKANGHAAGLD
jgi:hypothetical protein